MTFGLNVLNVTVQQDEYKSGSKHQKNSAADAKQSQCVCV